MKSFQLKIGFETTWIFLNVMQFLLILYIWGKRGLQYSEILTSLVIFRTKFGKTDFNLVYYEVREMLHLSTIESGGGVKT